MEQQKDEKLWRIARRRADFRRHLYGYIVVNTFLWAVWWFTTGKITGMTGYPWPVWVMLGWGLSLGFQYYKAYQGDRAEMADKEYERLKKQEEKS